jgi:hypothetical protein
MFGIYTDSNSRKEQLRMSFLLYSPPFRLRLCSLLPAVALVSVPLLLAGCGSGGSDKTLESAVSQTGWTVRTALPSQSTRKWTVLVYLNAANDLEPFSNLNVNQMEKIGSTSDVNIVIQYKRMGGLYDPSGGTWTNTRRYYVTKDSDTSTFTSELLSDKDSVDMGDPQTLKEFVQWGIAAYPAQKYCLVLWNHGAGWRSRAASTTASLTRGISYDDNTGSHIDTIELGNAIDIGRKWDVLAFDASLMQMVEVAQEIKDQTTYIVGSEESPPGEGYPYDLILGHLVGTPDQTALTFAEQIAQDNIDSYGASSEITESVLDSSKIAAIAPAMNTLGSALTAAKGTWGNQIASARDSAEDYAYPENKDLIDFLNKLSPVTDTGVQKAVQQVRSALSAAIIKSVNGAQHPNSKGIAAFLPSPSEYSTIQTEQLDGFGQTYSSLAFSQAAPNWLSFLQNGPN